MERLPHIWRKHINYTINGGVKSINEILRHVRFIGHMDDVISVTLNDNVTSTVNITINVVDTSLLTAMQSTMGQVVSLPITTTRSSVGSASLATLLYSAYSETYLSSYFSNTTKRHFTQFELIVTPEAGTVYVSQEIFDDDQTYSVNSNGGLYHVRYVLYCSIVLQLLGLLSSWWW